MSRLEYVFYNTLTKHRVSILLYRHLFLHYCFFVSTVYTLLNSRPTSGKLLVSKALLQKIYSFNCLYMCLYCMLLCA